jgi:hypothetical protein
LSKKGRRMKLISSRRDPRAICGVDRQRRLRKGKKMRGERREALLATAANIGNGL